MAAHRIICITRDRADPDRRIDAFGVEGIGTLTIDQLLSWIQAGHQFWVAGPPSVWVEVLRHPSSRRLYVRTVPDGRHDNNLYALPECS